MMDRTGLSSFPRDRLLPRIDGNGKARTAGNIIIVALPMVNRKINLATMCPAAPVVQKDREMP
jgi:hypothetical protein